MLDFSFSYFNKTFDILYTAYFIVVMEVKCEREVFTFLVACMANLETTCVVSGICIGQISAVSIRNDTYATTSWKFDIEFPHSKSVQIHPFSTK